MAPLCARRLSFASTSPSAAASRRKQADTTCMCRLLVRGTEIDALNARIYDTVNNGVYKAGFARTQPAYDTAVTALFESLDWLEARLSRQSCLVGETLTEADWRLFTSLLRLDLAYHRHFKCNIRRLVDYPALWDFTRALYQIPGIAATVNIDHIKRHYYLSHPWLDPSGIVPAGPSLDLAQPSRRQIRAPHAAAT
jgi:putative glutathione S-transferase